MTHIEMLGTPGSGKSSLAAALRSVMPGLRTLETGVLESLRSRAADPVTRRMARIVSDPSNRLWRSVYARSPDRFAALGRFIAANPGLVEGVAEAQRNRASRDVGQDLVWGWFLNLATRFQLASELHDSGRPLLIDEGFCQRGVAIFAHGFAESDTGALDDYLTRAPSPDAVIVVSAPLEVCESRLDQRGWSQRLESVGPDARTQFLEGSTKVVGQITDRLEKGDVRVIRVDGTLSADTTAAGLLDQFSGP